MAKQTWVVKSMHGRTIIDIYGSELWFSTAQPDQCIVCHPTHRQRRAIGKALLKSIRRVADAKRERR